MADVDFLDMTLDPTVMEAFAKAEPGSVPLVVQHNHGFITAQKVEQPRDEGRVLAKIKTLAAMAGDFYYYEWNTKNRDGTKGTVTGGTIKLANDLARTYGNCINTIDCRKVDNHLLFKARFTDLETGYSLERMFQQRMVQNIGKNMDADRAADIVFQIGQSKAIRNVTLNALQTFADFAVEEARASLIEKIGKNVQHYQEAARNALEDLGIDLANVERVLARTIDQWRAKDLARVRANLNSIRDGMATKEDLFPSHAQSAPSMESENLAQQANATAAGAPDPKAKPAGTEQAKPAADAEKPKEAVPEKKPAEPEPEKAKEPEPEKAKTEDAGEIPEGLRRDKPKAEDKPKGKGGKKAAKPDEAQAPLIDDASLGDEGKDLFVRLTNGLEAALKSCEDAKANDPLFEFNDRIMEDRKALVEPWKAKFKALMQEAWTREF